MPPHSFRDEQNTFGTHRHGRMALDRDKVIAAVTDYYEWLLRLHLRPDNLRRPPPGGWPEISPERFKKMGKTDTAIDLLKHLFYVEIDDNVVPLLVWSFSSCCDYSARKLQQDVTKRGGDGTYAGLGFQEAQYCSYEKLYKPFPQIISLACPKVGTTRQLAYSVSYIR